MIYIKRLQAALPAEELGECRTNVLTYGWSGIFLFNSITCTVLYILRLSEEYTLLLHNTVIDSV